MKVETIEKLLVMIARSNIGVDAMEVILEALLRIIESESPNE